MMPRSWVKNITFVKFDSSLMSKWRQSKPHVKLCSPLQYSLPMPQGGKHGNNPHLVEDQRFPQQRLSHKARQKTNVFDPDYVAGASPFSDNDIYSRAANLQIRDSQCGGGRRRANPNAARKKFVKKKWRLDLFLFKPQNEAGRLTLHATASSLKTIRIHRLWEFNYKPFFSVHPLLMGWLGLSVYLNYINTQINF